VLRLDDQWIWDSWVVDDGDLYHLFFLKAPRALGSPEKRHVNATVGHATSRDLITWEYLGECFGLATASNGAFDNLAIWTGSVVRDHHQWWMFYTAISTAGHHIFDQRIGSVVSDDLHHWKGVGADPVVLADSCWYKTLAAAPAATEGPDLEHSSETWRDPVVFEDPAGAGWYLLISARAVGAGQNDDGVIAHATSADLAARELGPPLCQPGGGFGQLEVLQNKIIDGRPVLAFTCHPHEMTAQRIAESSEYCTWSLPSPGLLGPWDIHLARPFSAEPDLFAASPVQLRDGSWVIVGFRNLEPRGIDVFEIIDPIPGTLDDEGYLVAR
jgi:beta-fructofuranosidase